MAKRIRQPPGASDNLDPRAYEYFFADLHDQNKLVGQLSYDLPSIGPGNSLIISIPVKGALPDEQQTVEYGLPSNWDTGLHVSAAYVSAVDTVRLVIYNATGSSIDMALATYSARVRP